MGPRARVQMGTVTYAAGDVIAGKYRLTSVLGEGGMGAVWLALNIKLGVDVAIKLIRREVASSETAQRLLVEARVAARIEHPSIVRVYDFGQTTHRDPFLVMEVLKGESLAELLDRKGRLPAINAVQTLLPVAHALGAAHDKGIIHRDVKPENIVLLKDNRGAVTPKVVDFGIAKLRQPEPGRRNTRGGIVGTPDYMSPEQSRGAPDLDERTDVWALSVLLYEAIAGERPFDGDSTNAVLAAILERVPPPTHELGGGDADLWRIIERGLAKDRTQRWPTMSELGRALAEWLLDRDVDVDVTGTSLTLQWLMDGARRPFSEVPLQFRRRAGSAPELPRGSSPDIGDAVPTSPAATPAHAALPTQAAAPPRAPDATADMGSGPDGSSPQEGRAPATEVREESSPDVVVTSTPPSTARIKPGFVLAAAALVLLVAGVGLVWRSSRAGTSDGTEGPSAPPAAETNAAVAPTAPTPPLPSATAAEVSPPPAATASGAPKSKRAAGTSGKGPPPAREPGKTPTWKLPPTNPNF